MVKRQKQGNFGEGDLQIIRERGKFGVLDSKQGQRCIRSHSFMANHLHFDTQEIGKGHVWTAQTRQQIVYDALILHEDSDYIIRTVFMGKSPNKAYLETRMRELREWERLGEEDKIANYILGPLKRGGHARKLTAAEIAEIVEMRFNHRQLKLGLLCALFNSRYQYPLLEGLSKSTMSRILHRARITKKEGTQIPLQLNPKKENIRRS